MMDFFDAAVIGAGPAGSSAAIMLARRGYSVALVDRSLFPREKLCGDFVSPINWPLFEVLGVAGEILSLDHQKVTGFRISSFSGAEATVPFPARNGRHLFGLGMRRFHLDHLLLKRAESQGARVVQGVRVMGLKWENGRWSLTLGNHSMEQRLQAACLVGADGRNSWVAHRLGLARLGERSGKYLAFQLHVRGAKNVNGEVQIHLFPGGYAGLLGLGGGTANLCFTVERARIKKDLSIEALLQSCLYKNCRLRESLGDGEIGGDVRTAYPVYFYPRRFCGDGFLLVGDAALVTEPVTGEGIYFALRSGVLAAGAIDRAFRQGGFASQKLSSYEHACQIAFSMRRRANRLIRALVYRPS